MFAGRTICPGPRPLYDGRPRKHKADRQTGVLTEISVVGVPLGDALGARPLLRRERHPQWRIIAWTVVALVHLLFITIFMVSQNIARPGRILTAQETELLLHPSGHNHAPNVPIVNPRYPDTEMPQIVPAPITLPPPPPPPTAQEVFQSIGQSMACGAGTYETLPAADRARCRHVPWHGKKLPNGTVVLDTLPKPPPPKPEFHMTGGDFQRRQTETADPCPILAVTPCIHKELYGNGPP
jgi:hypothetical protein